MTSNKYFSSSSSYANMERVNQENYKKPFLPDGQTFFQLSIIIMVSVCLSIHPSVCDHNLSKSLTLKSLRSQLSDHGMRQLDISHSKHLSVTFAIHIQHLQIQPICYLAYLLISQISDLSAQISLIYEIFVLSDI